jgi:hypothetical protein
MPAIDRGHHQQSAERDTMSKKPSRVARDEAGGKSFDGFSLPPHAIVVIGVDTQHDDIHPLYSKRAVDIAVGRVDYDDRMYRSIKAKGVITPIRVRLENVPESHMPESQPWPKAMHGKVVHVVVAGRHRVLYGRRVVDEMFAAGEIGDRTSWQIKCTLEHAKSARELVEVVADENVCRRVLDDTEIAEGIQRGLNIGMTLKEMADRYGVSEAKAKRLLARAEGVPAKPPKEKPKQVPGRVLSAVAAHMRNGVANTWQNCLGEDIASLIDVVRGKCALSDATQWVQRLIEDADGYEVEP